MQPMGGGVATMLTPCSKKSEDACQHGASILAASKFR